MGHWKALFFNVLAYFFTQRGEYVLLSRFAETKPDPKCRRFYWRFLCGPASNMRRLHTVREANALLERGKTENICFTFPFVFKGFFLSLMSRTPKSNEEFFRNKHYNFIQSDFYSVKMSTVIKVQISCVFATILTGFFGFITIFLLFTLNYTNERH